MYKKAKDIVKKANPELLYDLYGGAGSFSFVCSDLVKKSICVENVPSSIKDGKKNAKLNNINNV